MGLRPRAERGPQGRSGRPWPAPGAGGPHGPAPSPPPTARSSGLPQAARMARPRPLAGRARSVLQHRPSRPRRQRSGHVPRRSATPRRSAPPQEGRRPTHLDARRGEPALGGTAIRPGPASAPDRSASARTVATLASGARRAWPRGGLVGGAARQGVFLDKAVAHPAWPCVSTARGRFPPLAGASL